MNKNLSKREKQILEYIWDKIQKNGYPPSVREIGKAVGLKSPSTVHSYLEKLQSSGFIRKNPAQPRTIEVLEKSFTYLPKPESFYDRELVSLPVVGQITAGQPILAYENIEHSLPLPLELVKDGEAFILKVKGDSMVNAGILNGDMAIIKQQNYADNGEIVAALLEDEATLKRFYKENDTIRLQPENDSMDPIYAKDAKILGKVIAIIRQY